MPERIVRHDDFGHAAGVTSSAVHAAGSAIHFTSNFDRKPRGFFNPTPSEEYGSTSATTLCVHERQDNAVE